MNFSDKLTRVRIQYDESENLFRLFKRAIVYRRRWFRSLIVVSFCASFSKLRVQSVFFAISLANKVLVDQKDNNASFSPLSRNIRYLDKILQYSASYFCRKCYQLKF